MDMSVIEGDEKPVNVATEYASEIHTYLREMEVSKLARAVIFQLVLK